MGRVPKKSLPATLAFVLQQVGHSVQELRKAAKLTQAELARRAGISLTTLNELETRQCRDVRLSTLSQIASVLNTPVARLLQVPDVRLSQSEQTQLLTASEAIVRIAKRLREN